MNKILLLLFVLVVVSCRKEPQTPQEMILGHWAIQDTFKESSSRYNRYFDSEGFEFLPDSICDYKVGFQDYERYMDDAKRYMNDTTQEPILYDLGTKTKYAFANDSLKIFNLSKKKWDSFKIKKLTKDTLVISGENELGTFVKEEYNIDKVTDFDAVIVSSTGCYGPCPVMNIMVNKSGDVKFRGSFHTLKKGDYVAKISKSEFNKIALKFKQADYMSLDNDYYKETTDSRTVSVVFIKDGKIIKSITDYAASSPNEFFWAYQPLLTFDQKLNLTPIKTPHHLKTSFLEKIKGVSSRMEISDSEVYFLMNQLETAKETNVIFKETYSFNPNNDAIKMVTTDGRFYKFHFKNSSSKIIDLGYNFFQSNKLSHKFEYHK